MTPRQERAVKLLGAIIDGTVRNLGGIICPKPLPPTGRMSIMNQRDLYDAIQDVNAWLEKQGVPGRIQRLDSSGSPEWGLVDL